nr:MAG TPA: hypothetical protein [Caudoviricetes sp.]
MGKCYSFPRKSLRGNLSTVENKGGSKCTVKYFKNG